MHPGNRTARCAILAAIVMCGASAGLARAQPDEAIGRPEGHGPWMDGVSVADQEAAKALFKEGNALMKDAFFRAAADKYRAALALWQHPAFHYNLAMAQRALDQPIAARASLERGLGHGAAPLGTARYDYGRRMLTLLESQLGRVTVVCRDRGARVRLDGSPLFEGPGERAVWVRSGDHQLVAKKPDRIPDARQLEVTAGARPRVELRVRVEGRVEFRRRWPLWPPWLVTGVGVALVAGGAYWDRASSREFARYDAAVTLECGSRRGCPSGELPAEVGAMRETAERWQWMARVVYAAGGAAVVTGLTLLYLNREQVVHVPGGRESPGASVQPVVSPGQVGVRAEFRF